MNPLLVTPVIRDALTSAKVNATFTRLTPDLARQRITLVWWQSLPQNAPPEDDMHWDWSRIAEALANQLEYEVIALQTQDGRVHGAIAYHLLDHSQKSPASRAVQVKFLASAPWNRPWIAAPQLRGVGTALLTLAILHSYALGFEGRTWLQSLPNAMNYYLRMGFEIIQPPTDDDLAVLELPATAAVELLTKQGFIT